MNGAPDRPRYRAWRFLFPDVDAGEEFAGIATSAQGRIAMVANHDSVRQAILLLLATIPGERVMRPDYGCLLHRLAFAPNDDTTAGLAIYYVRRAIERWEPRVAIVRVDANRNPYDQGRLDVVLEYQVRGTPGVQTLAVAVPLAGEDF